MIFRITLLLSLSLLTCSSLFALQVKDTVYINRGTFTAFNSDQFAYLAFNETSNFNQENARFVMNTNDTLVLRVINNDSLEHGFAVKNTNINSLLNSGDSITISYSSALNTAAIFYDPLLDYNYLGLSGMIVVTNHARNFFWNMKDHQQSWNDSIANSNAVNWSDYYPDYFTINGRSNPDINTDSSARVRGNVGDTIHIYMVNTGRSLHSIHFHGYHSTIIGSSKFPTHVGRSKDTFPVYAMDYLVLELVPDQKGEYPVHDHNLVAVSGGGMYPNGMFLTLLID
jgi:FtsP/CotA-like multicopper oxidase with cupredoxin domain